MLSMSRGSPKRALSPSAAIKKSARSIGYDGATVWEIDPQRDVTAPLHNRPPVHRILTPLSFDARYAMAPATMVSGGWPLP